MLVKTYGVAGCINFSMSGTEVAASRDFEDLTTYRECGRSGQAMPIKDRIPVKALRANH
jgi:hypothetical protein